MTKNMKIGLLVAGVIAVLFCVITGVALWAFSSAQ